MLPPNLAAFKAEATKLGREGFVRRYPLGVLVGLTSQASEDPDADDDTVVFSLSALRKRAPNVESFFAPVCKRPGNAFPSQIFVGRVESSDIRLDDPSVTRVHAYFKVAGDAVTGVRDCGSTNGTFVGSARLARDELRAVRFGDAVTFGVVELRYVSAGVVYDMLRR